MAAALGNVGSQVQGPVQQTQNEPVQSPVEPAFCTRLTESVTWAWNASIETLVDWGSSLKDLIGKVVTAVGDFFAPAVDWVKEKIYGPAEPAATPPPEGLAANTQSVTEAVPPPAQNQAGVQQDQALNVAANAVPLTNGNVDANDAETNGVVVVNEPPPPASVANAQTQQLTPQQQPRGFWSNVPIVNWFV